MYFHHSHARTSISRLKKKNKQTNHSKTFTCRPHKDGVEILVKIGYRNFIHMLLRSPMPFPPVGCIKTVGYSPVRSRRVLFFWATISVIVGLTYSIILIQSAFISLLIYDESWRKRTSEMWLTVSRSSFDVGGVALDTSSNKDQWTRTFIRC